MASAQQVNRPSQSYAMGVTLCLAGALCWSSVGVLVRLTDGNTALTTATIATIAAIVSMMDVMALSMVPLPGLWVVSYGL